MKSEVHLYVVFNKFYARSLSYIRQHGTHSAHVSEQTILHQYKNTAVKTKLKTVKTKRFRISKRPMWESDPPDCLSTVPRTCKSLGLKIYSNSVLTTSSSRMHDL
jgi:hypothetical protein